VGRSPALPGIGTMASVAMDVSLLERDKNVNQWQCRDASQPQTQRHSRRVSDHSITQAIPAGGLMESTARHVRLQSRVSRNKGMRTGAEETHRFRKCAGGVRKKRSAEPRWRKRTRPLAAWLRHVRVPTSKRNNRRQELGIMKAPACRAARDSHSFRNRRTRLRQTTTGPKLRNGRLLKLRRGHSGTQRRAIKSM